MRIYTDLFIEKDDTPSYKLPQAAFPTGVLYLSSRAKLYLPDSPSETLRYITALADTLAIARDTLMFPPTPDDIPTVELSKVDTLYNGTYE